MERTPENSTASNLDYTDTLQNIEPFYQRPEGTSRNLTEVAPRSEESDAQFIKRSSGEFDRQYPSAKKAERAKMGKLTLEAERQQIMHQEHEEAKQTHQLSADAEYRDNLADLQARYRTTIKTLDDLLAQKVLPPEAAQKAKHEARSQWLNGRKEANEQYDSEYHRRVDVGTPSSEATRQFRERQEKDLNQKHEQLVNYEADRLGISRALDAGLISKLAEGDFEKKTSVADLGDTIQRGMGGEVSADADRFINALWQPEVEAIKHNAVMRAVAEPVRSKNVVNDDGSSHDESHFILSIDNPEFTGYVTENIKTPGDTMAVLSGLSQALSYGTQEEALGRARWFYDIAHQEAGLDAEDIFNITQAFAIARGDNSLKWQERFHDFCAGTIDWGEQEQPSTKQDSAPIGLEEIKIETPQVIENLQKQLDSLIREFDIEYQAIYSASNKNLSGSSRGTSPKIDEIGRLSEEVVNLNRQIQHIRGTQSIVETIRGDADFTESGVTVHNPIYLRGAWASNSRCNVSAIKIESPASIGEAWGFIAEGTLTQESEIFYGMADSLETVKELFDGRHYRRTGLSPNIMDNQGIKKIGHTITPKRIREKVEHGWSETDLNNLIIEDEGSYRQIARNFVATINAGSPVKELVAEEINSITAEVEQPLAEAESSAAESEPAVAETIQPTEEIQPIVGDFQSDGDIQPSREIKPQIKDKELFNMILSNVSKRGRDIIKEKNDTLNQLTRTPRRAIEQMLSEQDIRKVAQILDANGRDHPKWLDEG